MKPIVTELTDWSMLTGSHVGYLRIFDVYFEEKIFRCIRHEGYRYEDNPAKRSNYWTIEIYSKDPSRYIRDFEFDAVQAQPFIDQFGLGAYL